MKRNPWQFAATTWCVVATVAAHVASAGSPPPPTPDEIVEVQPLLSAETGLGLVTYTPGAGLVLGDTGFRLGGYSSLESTRPEGEPGRFAFQELSFILVWDVLDRVQLFSEIEVEDLVDVDTSGNGGFGGADFQVERLYGDLTLDDLLNVRAGKFLTPVGRWNEIHAPPLVWTTSRPLATMQPFDNYTTGLMLFGSTFPARGALSYSLFGQFLDQLDSVDQRFEADRSVGARLEYTDPLGPSAGATYLAFRDDGDWRHLGGLDVALRKGIIDAMGELIVEEGENHPGTEWGFYAQCAVEVRRAIHLVARYEHYAPAGDSDVHLVGPGVAYRPVPYAIVKADYRIADRHVGYAPGGFFGSFAFLF